MPTVRKRGKSWRAEVRRKGITPLSATFSTKARAEAWAARIDTEIADGKIGNVPNKPFSAVLERYRDEVSTTKDGEKWERARIGLFLRDPIAAVNLRELNSTHVASWRDRRLKGTLEQPAVAESSVLREWKLLSNACTIAIKEWKWLKVNPFSGVRRPKDGDARDVIYEPDQIERLVFAMGDDTSTVMGRTCIAFLYAIETGMRAGEICKLHDTDIVGAVAKVRGVARGARKTQAAKRDVPQSVEALRLLSLLPRVEGDPRLFRLNTQQIDAHFRKGKARALIEGLHFHDTRATAITRMSKKLDILALARAIGHKDLRQLQVYYRESAADMAPRLG